MNENEGIGNINTKKCEECGNKHIVWMYYDACGTRVEKNKGHSFQYHCKNIKCGYHSVLRSIIQCHRCDDTGFVICDCKK